MDRHCRLLFALLLGIGAATLPFDTRLMASPGQRSAVESPQPAQATVKSASARTANASFDDDFQIEERLLVLANQSRQRAGAPPLMIDEGLSQAARIHAHAMLEERRLSHQFEGEPSLPQRLAAMTELQLEQEGENVALDYDAEHGHEHLMLSPPHRANLLNPAYNVVGLGVVHNGDRLYIVQDFGSALPKFSNLEVKEQVAAAVNQTRRRTSKSQLRQRDWLGADDAACSMAKADRLGTLPVSKLAENFNVLTFTSLHPDRLPSGAARVVAGRNLRTFSIGACYGRTHTYPNGTYWVVLSLE